MAYAKDCAKGNQGRGSVLKAVGGLVSEVGFWKFEDRRQTPIVAGVSGRVRPYRGMG